MTYTKRQWFLYRLGQCINLLSKTSLYFNVITEYTKSSKYKKRVKKINKKIDSCYELIRDFYYEIK